MKTLPPTLRNCVGVSVLSLMLLPAAYGQDRAGSTSSPGASQQPSGASAQGAGTASANAGQSGTSGMSGTFKPGRRVADVSEKMGFFDQMSPMKISCSSGTPASGDAKAGA